MSFICKNGPQHKHETVQQSRVCWGLAASPSSYAPAAPPALPTPPPVDWSVWYPKDGHRPPRPAGLSTWPQLDYINDLEGDVLAAYNLTSKQASDKIDHLKTQRKRREPVSDPRLDLIKGLIDMIPDGYYAVQAEEGATVDFLRMSRPEKNKYAGSIKFQTQHGPRLEIAGVLWPSGNWSIYEHSLTSMLLLMVADHHGANERYARLLGRCMRCRTELTDDRSRHYGIGPECETKNGWGWVIPTVDERNGGRSFETLRGLGLINLTPVPGR